jgi:hypothetical protein
VHDGEPGDQPVEAVNIGERFDEPVSVEEVGRRRTGPWLVAAAAVITGGVVVSAVTNGDDERASPPTTQVSSGQDAVATAAPTADQSPADQSPADQSPAEPDAPVLAPRPEQIAAVPFASGVQIFGYADDFEFVSVRLETGEVELIAPGQGDEFLPLSSDNNTIIGAAASTGVFFSLGTEGLVSQVDFDIHDAPLFFPAAGQNGYLKFGAWTGEIAYIDSNGAVTRVGATVPRGTKVLADSAAGPIVRGLDNQVRVLDADTGATLQLIDAEPIAIGSERMALVRCTSTECALTIEDLDGGNQIVTDYDPQIASRLIVGMSPDDRWLLVRHRGEIVILDASTGIEQARFEGLIQGSVHWLGGEYALLVEPNGEAAIWRVDTGEMAAVDLRRIISPELRGIWLLRTP